jgi:hypothetical protein
MSEFVIMENETLPDVLRVVPLKQFKTSWGRTGWKILEDAKGSEEEMNQLLAELTAEDEDEVDEVIGFEPDFDDDEEDSQELEDDD